VCEATTPNFWDHAVNKPRRVAASWHRSCLHPATVNVMMMSQGARDRAVPTPLHAEKKPHLDLSGSCCSIVAGILFQTMEASVAVDSVLHIVKSHPIILTLLCSRLQIYLLIRVSVRPGAGHLLLPGPNPCLHWQPCAGWVHLHIQSVVTG